MRRPIAWGLGMLLVLAGCAGERASDPTAVGSPETTTPTTVPATAEEPAADSGTVTATQGLLAADTARRDPAGTDPAEAAAGEAAFAADLLAVLGAGADGNLAVSPLSLRLALAMTYAGARGETAAQMAAALHFDPAGDGPHAGFNALTAVLESRNATYPAGEEERTVELSIANAVWGQQGLAVEQEFLEVLGAEYGAGMRIADFASDAGTARLTINDWVSGETNDRIPELIAPGSLTADTRMVLTNAVYLDADWAQPFDSAHTADGTFVRRDGSGVAASFMHRTGAIPYSAGEGWQAVDLSYAGEQLAMLLVLPDPGSYAAVAAEAGEVFAAARAGLQRGEVNLALPRFEFRTALSLPPALRALGMTDAFDGTRADFSGITRDEALFIGDVIHEVFVSVDEAGTEAAGATAVIMTRSEAVADPVAITFDRPFLFWLYDRETGSVLFAGRVLDPTA